MVDPIVNKAAQSATEQTAQQGPQQQRQVTADEQAQFEDALNRPPDSQETQPGDVAQVQDPGRVDGKSYQDALMEGIQNVRQNFEARGNKIEDGIARAAEDKVISPMELMQTQMDLVKMELEMQVVTKGGDKVSTDVQTLMNRSN